MYAERNSSLYDLFPWIVYDDDPISVLIVEDDMVMQAQFTSLVRTLDYDDVSIERVARAEDAKQLLEGDNFEHYDLIIADQFLEGTETGLDLWRYCRENHPDTKFILTSGEQLKNYLDQFAPALGKPEFLGKPFSSKQAIEKIARSLKEADGHKLMTNIQERDGVEVHVPEPEIQPTGQSPVGQLPVGAQTKWRANGFLILLGSMYLFVIYSQLGAIWGQENDRLPGLIQWSDEEKKTDEVEDLRLTDHRFLEEHLSHKKKQPPAEVPGVFNPPIPRD